MKTGYSGFCAEMLVQVKYLSTMYQREQYLGHTETDPCNGVSAMDGKPEPVILSCSARRIPCLWAWGVCQYLNFIFSQDETE